MKCEVDIVLENGSKMRRPRPTGMHRARGRESELGDLKADMTALSMHLFRNFHLTEYKYSGHLPENQGGKRIQPRNRRVSGKPGYLHNKCILKSLFTTVERKTGEDADA